LITRIPPTIISEISQNLTQEFNHHTTEVRKSQRVKIFPSNLNIYEINLPKALIAETLNTKEIVHKNYKEALLIAHLKQTMMSIKH